MNNPGKNVLEMPEFAPLAKILTTPIQADIVAFFQANPAEDLDAVLLAGKLHQEDIESVEDALEKLQANGVLSSEIKGISQSSHYIFTPGPPLKRAINRIFSEKRTRDLWEDFRGCLARESRRRQGKRKLLLLASAIVIALGLAAGIYCLVENIKAAGQEPIQEDLSQFTGIHETWYSNGQIKTRIEYSNGRREGSFSAWFENGQKMAEGSYRDSRPQGPWIYRNEKGEPLTMITFEDGRAVNY